MEQFTADATESNLVRLVPGLTQADIRAVEEIMAKAPLEFVAYMHWLAEERESLAIELVGKDNPDAGAIMIKLKRLVWVDYPNSAATSDAAQDWIIGAGEPPSSRAKAMLALAGVKLAE